MVEFTLEVDRKAIQEAENAVDEFLNQVAVELSNEMKSEAPVDRGQLRGSITIINQRNGRYTVAVQSKYAMALQNGTEAFTPPLEPLKEWGKRKLGSEKAGAAVWNKIREEGIDANPFATRAVENLEAKYS